MNFMSTTNTKKLIHEGDLVAQPGVTYDYQEITGTLDASGADTRTAFPKLTTVGGYLDARGADTRTAFPKLATIGGGLYASGADTRTAFPSLKSQNAGQPALDICRAALAAALARHGLILNDGILAKVVSQRGNISRIVVCGKTTISYVISVDDTFSHGATLREARDSLLYKIGSRDTSEFKAWKLTKVITKRDAIRAYRCITGACEAGVRQWCDTHDVPEKCTVAEAIELTSGAYGSDKFVEFFK